METAGLILMMVGLAGLGMCIVGFVRASVRLDRAMRRVDRAVGRLARWRFENGIKTNATEKGN